MSVPLLKKVGQDFLNAFFGQKSRKKLNTVDGEGKSSEWWMVSRVATLLG
ncbi:MAG TPA: hypothetical protein PLV50_13370 [Smithella sp.]|nr:hypothetical protein [Smithella sp.]HOG91526.1 hypothetical protein [Smithella sp.]